MQIRSKQFMQTRQSGENLWTETISAEIIDIAGHGLGCSSKTKGSTRRSKGFTRGPSGSTRDPHGSNRGSMRSNRSPKGSIIRGSILRLRRVGTTSANLFLKFLCYCQCSFGNYFRAFLKYLWVSMEVLCVNMYFLMSVVASLSDSLPETFAMLLFLFKNTLYKISACLHHTHQHHTAHHLPDIDSSGAARTQLLKHGSWRW